MSGKKPGKVAREPSPVAMPPAAKSPVTQSPAPASSIAVELKLMLEIASLPADARDRLTAWVAALPS
jgi:hypothetical protein